MQKLKKPVSIILSILMVVSMFIAVPITASAAYGYSDLARGTLIQPGDSFYFEDIGSFKFADYNDPTIIHEVKGSDFSYNQATLSVTDGYYSFGSTKLLPTSVSPGGLLIADYDSTTKMATFGVQNITHSFDETTGTLTIGGSGVVPRNYAFTGSDVYGVVFTQSNLVKHLIIDATDMIAIKQNAFMAYTGGCVLEDVEINSTSSTPLIIEKNAVFYESDNTVTLTVNAVEVATVSSCPINNYSTPVNLIYNVEQPITFNKNALTDPWSDLTVTFPAGCKIFIPGGPQFTDSQLQEEYDREAEYGYEEYFWRNHSDLVKGTDYVLGDARYEELTPLNASLVVGDSNTALFSAYTITDESVNGTVTASVNGTDVTEAAADADVLLTVAPDNGYQFKSISATYPKNKVEEFSDLVALMGDAVFSADDYADHPEYTCKVNDGKFVVYDGDTSVAELSEANMTNAELGGTYFSAQCGGLNWNLYFRNGSITDIYVYDSDYNYIFSSADGSKSTGTLLPAVVNLTTVTEGSQYSLTMPKMPVTVTAEFEEAASATYTVTWKNGDTVLETDTDVAEGTTPTYDGTAPTKAADDTYTYTFAAWDNGTTTYVLGVDDLPPVTGDVTYTAVFTATPKLFTGHSVTLGGDVGVNFFLNPDVLNNYSGTKTVKFTVDGKETTVDVPATATDNGYMVTCNVVAAQMAHKIKAVVYVNGTALDQTDSYSVQDYAEGVYKDENKPEKLRALAKAMLNYGAMAQTVFDSALKDHPALANKTVGNNGYEGVTADQIGDAVKGTSADLNKVAEKLGAEFYTSSLIYLSENTLRLYFTPASKTVGALDGKGFSDSLSGYYYYVDHENIPAAELDEQKELTVGDYTFTYTALDYAKAVVNSGMGGDQKNLAKALYLYNKAANEYFDAAPAPVENVVDLGALTGDYEAQNNDVLTGTLAGQYKITIADGATVTLKDATITCLSSNTQYDGIALLGDATILLEGENTVKGGYKYNAGIFVPENKTLTIDGTGSLNVSSGGSVAAIGAKRSGIANGTPGGNIVINGGTINATGGNGGAGIGGCTVANCGTITINGGNITAVGKDNAPGIGSGNRASYCAGITINGGTVTATGNNYAAGIGSGQRGSCGDITIAATVTQVTATKGYSAPNSIGAGKDGSCGTVTIEDNSKVTQN